MSEEHPGFMADILKSGKFHKNVPKLCSELVWQVFMACAGKCQLEASLKRGSLHDQVLIFKFHPCILEILDKPLGSH